MASISTLNVNGLNYDIEDAGARSLAEQAKATANAAVQSVKIKGSATEYRSGNKVVLPAYPTSLPASDVVNTYNSASEKPISGKGVAAAIPSWVTKKQISYSMLPVGDGSNQVYPGTSGKALEQKLSNCITDSDILSLFTN